MKIWVLHKRDEYDESDIIYVHTSKEAALSDLNRAIDYDDDPNDPDPIEMRARHVLVEFDVDAEKTTYSHHHVNIDKDGNVVKVERMDFNHAAFVINNSRISGLIGTAHFLIPNENKEGAVEQALHYYNEMVNSEGRKVLQKWHRQRP